MIIRPLNKDDVFQHERVASQSFVYDCDVDSKENTLPCEYMLGAFCDDGKTLMADMEIEKRQCFFENGRLSCLAVGGVASKPEYRNKGAVRAIFNTLMNDENQNADISLLYPFSEAYYRKFGYESIGRAVEIKVTFSEFKNIPRFSDVFLYEEQDNGRFLELYNSSAKKNRLAFVREDTKHFTFDPYNSLLYTYVLTDYSAYVSFSVNRSESTVFVKEIEFLSKESLLKIIGFLRAFEGNQKYIVFQKLSENSPILNLIPDKKDAEIKLFSAGAARVLDVESVLGKRVYPGEKGSFTIECRDEIKKNNGVFLVEYGNGSADVKKITDSEADVVMNAPAFSQLLLCGIRDAASFEYLDGIEIRRFNKDFFRAFPFVPCFVNDEF